MPIQYAAQDAAVTQIYYNTWRGWNQTTSAGTINANYIWNTWNDINTTSTGSIYFNTATNDTWGAWNNTWNTIDPNVWNYWVQQPGVYDAPAPITWRPQAPAIVRTEEEWTVIREEQERQRRLRDAAQAEARAEARKLMEVVLSKEQMNDYLTKGYFEVIGSEGGVFRIYHGTSGNLKQVVDGQEINALCVHPRLLDHRSDEGEGVGYLPTEDSMIAQAFSLMHDELGTVQTANVHRGPRHLRAVPDLAAA